MDSIWIILANYTADNGNGGRIFTQPPGAVIDMAIQ